MELLRSEQSLPDDDASARFLTLFLSSERELFRYVAALVPSIPEAEEIRATAIASLSVSLRSGQWEPASTPPAALIGPVLRPANRRPKP